MNRAFRRLVVLLALLLAFGLAVLQLPSPPRITVPSQPPLQGAVERILIEKSKRQMSMMRAGKVIKTYQIALGSSPVGDKSRQGDGRTPEGMFKIDRKNEGSKFHLSLGLNYPLAEDRAAAKKAGYSAGGDIMIHGQPNALPDATVLKQDWTAGCIAVSNAEIREIFAAVTIGTAVEIRP